ncbi:amidohydrolase family protein [Taibaiella soli]|uniref:Amidohydrolase n=1 Tax=Taibaiella soli TaxID=1649169 RepID=A0A2W2AF61_9BACT|nr:amidohydrolase family protein [Taibaiella soli]PZF72202.1 amidohydrolase [Taibaiella soli]
MIITADRIHDGEKWLPLQTAIEIADDGTITNIYHNGHPEAEYITGVLTPGFVNVHCHMELSHMKGVIPEHTGLIPFLQGVMFRRNDFTEEQKINARHEAYETMWQNGIVAVGDIANGTDTLDLRSKEKMHVHTFVECIGFSDTTAPQRFEYSRGVYDQFAAQHSTHVKLKQSIVPHAPYSVSKALFKLIDRHEPSEIISIHNQETPAEDQFYIDKTGAVNDLLDSLKIDASFFEPSGKSSLKTYIEWLNPHRPVVFIHNTCTGIEDLHKVQAHQYNSYWCLCPNANLYIENRLPDVPMLMAEGADICIGTDSLSSNHQLSVLAEIATLKKHFPQIEWETLLQWATSNGAMVLNMQDEIGSIAIGKKPSIVQILDLDSTPLAKRVV